MFQIPINVGGVCFSNRFALYGIRVARWPGTKDAKFF